jgi:hypothetical protein
VLKVSPVLNVNNGVIEWIGLIDGGKVTVNEVSGLCDAELCTEAEVDINEDSDVEGDAETDFSGLTVSDNDDDSEPVFVEEAD